MDKVTDVAQSPARSIAPWSLILLVGGSGWLVVATTAIMWLWPMSGKIVEHTHYLSSPARAFQHLLVFAVSALAYRIAFSGLRPDYRARPVLFVAFQIVLAAAVVRLAPFAGGIAAGLIDHSYTDFHDTVDYWLPFKPALRSMLNPLQFFLPPYLLGLALIALVQVAREYHAESLRAARLSAAYSEARLAMLSAQLQPHFLFNALHAIIELVDQSPKRATVMLARLGDFLRHALESSKQPWVSVATEVAGLEAYLAVQQVRYSDRLQVQVSVDPGAATLTMPSMLMQPLAENAVEHGRCGPSSTLAVRIIVGIENQRLRLAVSNSTPTMSKRLPPERYGTGLSNVESRLQAAYGSDASLMVGPDPQGGTEAVLNIPARLEV